MKIRVQYTGQLRTALGRTIDEVELPEQGDLAELLSRLIVATGGASGHLVNASGQMQPGLLVVVNEAAIAATTATQVVLREGDIVTLLPPIAGG